MNDASITAWATGFLAVGTLGVAIATLLYALATRNLALNAHLGTRAQIVSGARHSWIDAIRDEVAEFLSIDAEIKSDDVYVLGKEYVHNLKQRRLMIRHQIEFRLDPQKPRHVELLRHIDRLIDTRIGNTQTEKDARQLTVAITEDEWRRVRREVGAKVSADSLGKDVVSMPVRIGDA